MFLSYEYIKNLEYDDKTDKYRFQYKIIDSEFEEVGVAVGVASATGTEVAVIDTYEKRGLNVAANLIKAIVWCSKEYGWSVSELITWNREYNPKFSKYDKELEKYLLLL